MRPDRCARVSPVANNAVARCVLVDKSPASGQFSWKPEEVQQSGTALVYQGSYPTFSRGGESRDDLRGVWSVTWSVTSGRTLASTCAMSAQKWVTDTLCVGPVHGHRPGCEQPNRKCCEPLHYHRRDR
jgi:hypothetical protein